MSKGLQDLLDSCPVSYEGEIQCVTIPVSLLLPEIEVARQLAEQRAELLEALRRAADTVERDDLDTPICCDGRDCGCMGSSNRQLFVHDLRALVERIANATQQRNDTGGNSSCSDERPCIPCFTDSGACKDATGGEG